MKSKVLAEAVVKVLNEMQQDGSYKKLMDEFGLLPNSQAVHHQRPRHVSGQPAAATSFAALRLGQRVTPWAAGTGSVSTNICSTRYFCAAH